MTRHILAASTALAAALIITSAAQAQTDPNASAPVPAVQPTAHDTSNASAGGQPASATDDGTLTEIVVTATKRETSLEKTPIAISAFSQATLDRQQVKDVTDLAKFVPSLQFAQQGDQSAVLLTLRGIGNDSAYTEVADPEVAIYVDGIYSPRAQGASVLMYDMERVEVLRGPQGTLFGRNATVGALSLITAKPTLDKFYGSVEAVGGAYNRFGIRGMLNIPVTDTLAIRTAFITDRHDGYINFQQAPAVANVNRSAFVTSGKKYYAGDQKSARVSALWQPSDRFKWTLSGEYYKDTGSPILQLMQTPRAGQKFWSALVDTAPQQDRYSVDFRSNMSYKVSDKIELDYIAGWSRVGGGGDSDADAGALPPTGLTVTSPGDATPRTGPLGAFGENRTVSSRYDFQSHEVQLKSTGTNTIDWILGAYYSHEKNRIRFDIDQRDGYRDGTFSWAGSFIQADREIDSRAAFGQAVYHISSRIRLTGGLRYTSDKKKDVGGRNVTYSGDGCTAADKAAGGACTTGIFGAFPDATGNQLATLLPGYGISNNDTHGKWNKLTYLARADADITDHTFGYASISSGFKSGNIEDGGLLAGPETLTNYEVGLKQKFLDNRATLNVAAYYSDFKGYQVNQAITTRDANNNVTGSQIVTTNAKGAKAYGIEAELNANVTRQDHIQIAATVQKTKFDTLLTVDNRLYNNTPANIENLAGNELAHAPRFSATGSYEHDFELANGGSLSPRATVHYETSSWLSYFNGDVASRYADPTGKGTFGTGFDKQKAYAKIDLALRYSAPDDRYAIEAFGLNVNDKKIRTSAGAFGPPNNAPVFLSNYMAPRTWGVRASAKF